jgi:hypothetical protein
MSYHSPKKIQAISEKFLRECFTYNPETGELFWNYRPQSHFDKEFAWQRWNRRYGGKLAGSFNIHGYRRTTILGLSLLASHICWFLGTGKHPEHQLDHINGQRSDDRLANLREAPGPINQRNAKLLSSNKTGLVGIGTRTWRGKYTYFTATARVGGKQFSKVCKTLDEAVLWRNRMVEAAGDYHPNHGRLQ